MRVAICGAGYVGLASAAALAVAGHEVRVLDRDPERISQLLQGSDPLEEPFLAEALARSSVSFTTDSRSAYESVEAILLAVGTPQTPAGNADLSQLDAAVATVADVAPSCVVLIRSTVPVGTGDRLQRGILRRCRVISNPEFLREGHAIEDSLKPDRVVAGGEIADDASVRDLYGKVLDQSFDPLGELEPARDPVPLLWMDRRSAELAKYAANAFLATKLSFVNEIANVASEVGADIRSVTKVIGSDRRIGPAFLRPGIGWGGSCFPKDTRALAAFALESGYDFTVLRAVIDQNNAQLSRFFEQIRHELAGRQRPRVGLLGLAFKAGTSDVRESPAVALAKLLLAEGWEVQAFDPAVRANARGLPPGLRVADTIEEIAVDADALVVATEWPEFAAADYASLAHLMRGNVLLDGRCIIDPEQAQTAGLRYVGICPPGRATE